MGPRALLVAGIVSVLGWRLAERAHPVAGLLFVLPLLLPGSLPALALVRIQHLLPTAVLDVPLLLSLAQATRFAGVAYVLGRIAHASLPDGERNAAQVLPPFTRRWRVLFPRALPALATSTLVVSVLVLGEVECTNLLVPPGYVSPVLALHNFLHFRYDADAAALAVLLAAIGGALALLLVRLGRGLR